MSIIGEIDVYLYLVLFVSRLRLHVITHSNSKDVV